jgi:hypothetical protein
MLVSYCRPLRGTWGRCGDVASAYLTPVHSCSLADGLMLLRVASPCWVKFTVLCNWIVQRLVQKHIIERFVSKRGNNDVIFLFTPCFSP